MVFSVPHLAYHAGHLSRALGDRRDRRVDLTRTHRGAQHPAAGAAASTRRDDSVEVAASGSPSPEEPAPWARSWSLPSVPAATKPSCWPGRPGSTSSPEPGSAAALDGVQVVIDVASTQTLKDEQSRAFFGAVTRTLLAAEVGAGVTHHVALSIVGVDKAPYGYYAGKVLQEQLIAAGPVPWTILRATQFHEFARQIFGSVRLGPLVLIPAMRSSRSPPTRSRNAWSSSPFGRPSGRVSDLAGPRVERMADLARRYARAAGRRGRVLEVRLPGAYGTAMRDEAGCWRGRARSSASRPSTTGSRRSAPRNRRTADDEPHRQVLRCPAPMSTPSIASNMRCAAVRPSCCRFASMLVSSGRELVASTSQLSKPITATSSGTSRPEVAERCRARRGRSGRSRRGCASTSGCRASSIARRRRGPSAPTTREHRLADELEPGRRERLARAGRAVLGRGVARVAGDVRDAGAAAGEQVLDRQPPAADVVGGEREVGGVVGRRVRVDDRHGQVRARARGAGRSGGPPR